MKKQTRLLFAAMIIVATAATLFVGCKKEKDEAAANADRSEAQALLNRIEAFQTLRDAVNSGAKADGSMTVEEMQQALDLVSNYEHSEHMTYCLNTVLDTLHVAMPVVDDEGRVSEADVVATYNAFETALGKCILGVNDGMDVPSLFSVVMPEIGSKEGNDIEIVFTRGEESECHNVRCPFEEGDDYKWGQLLGPCDSLQATTPTDAAYELTQMFLPNLPPVPSGWLMAITGVEYVTYTPYQDELINPINGWKYWEPSVTPSCSDRWLYCICGEFSIEPCIPWYELNCYYNNINTNAVLETGQLHLSPTYHSPYVSAVVNAHHLYEPIPGSQTGEKRSVRLHTLTITYYVYHLINPNPSDQ